MWAIAKTKIMCWELEQASEQKSKHASKQRSAKKWPLKLYLQSILHSHVKWGCVYMETVCFNIRILYMWHNVHIDVCLCNCQHVGLLPVVIRICTFVHMGAMHYCTCVPIKHRVRLYTCLLYIEGFCRHTHVIFIYYNSVYVRIKV